MAEVPEFVERARQELSAEEVGALKTYAASTQRGRILFIPVVRKWGQVQWTSRVVIKGAMGPLPTSRATLKAIGAPEEWFEKSKAFVDALQEQFPALLEAAPTRRRALPAGEREEQ